MINEKDINITPQMLLTISELDEFKGAWRLLEKMAPEKLTSLKKVATIESIGSSNRIEGNKLSDKEVEELLSKISKQSFASRDEEEVAGYSKLMDMIFDDWEVIPLSENHIKQLHQILMQYSTKDVKHKGEYKKISNTVMAYSPQGKEIGVVFETSTPFDTPFKMEELVNWTRKNLKDKFYHPLMVIGIFIVRFLAIHPFEDGNGRLSRALTALLLLKSGYIYTPYSSLESVIEDNKEGYYRALHQTQTTLCKTSDYEPWLLFFFKALQKQKIRLEHKLNVYSKTDLSLPELSVKILEIFEKQERASVKDIIKYTGANPNTVKKHLATLVGQGRLIKYGKTRGAWYVRSL